MKDYRRATRKTVVKEYQKLFLKRGDFGFPQDDLEVVGKTDNEVWQLWITYQTGFLPTKSRSKFFKTEQALDEYVELAPVGSVLNELDEPLTGQFEKVKSIIEAGSSIGAKSRIYNSPLDLEILAGAGILKERDFNISDEVLNFLGSIRIRKSKK